MAPSPTHAAFVDELEKIAASRQMMRIPQSRIGRRPMTVMKMLALDAAGKLFKRASSIGTLINTLKGPNEAVTRRASSKRQPSDDNNSQLDQNTNLTQSSSGSGGEWQNMPRGIREAPNA